MISDFKWVPYKWEYSNGGNNVFITDESASYTDLSKMGKWKKDLEKLILECLVENYTQLKIFDLDMSERLLLSEIKSIKHYHMKNRIYYNSYEFQFKLKSNKPDRCKSSAFWRQGVKLAHFMDHYVMYEIRNNKLELIGI